MKRKPVIDMSKTEPHMTLTVDLKLLIEPSKGDAVRRIDIDKLAESIKAVGLINPITVVKDEIIANRYRILAGRRRYWACLAAGIKNITCSIVDIDKPSAGHAIEVTENLHRVQLTPMQEAEAIQKLRGLKRSDESIAADLGMTRQFVARRAKLLDLSKKWKNSLLGKGEKGTDSVRNWSVACLEMVARYAESRQNDILEHFCWDGIVPDVQELKQFLSHDEQGLLAAPWKLEDESLHPKAGSCTNCPKRSGAQPLLFDDEVKTGKTKVGDKCLDSICWEEKLAKHSEIALTAARKKYPDAIMVSSDYRCEKHKSALGKYSYTAVKKKAKGAKLAIFVDGNQAGRTLWIQIGKGLMGPDSKKTEAAKLKKKPLTDKDRAQRLRDRRNKWIIDHVRTELMKDKKDWPVLSIDDVLNCVITCGLTLHDYKEHIEMPKVFPTIEENAQLSNAEIYAKFWKNFRQDIARRLCVVQTGIIASEIVPTLDELFHMMGTDEVNLWAKAAEEIPDKHNYLKERPVTEQRKKSSKKLSKKNVKKKGKK